MGGDEQPAPSDNGVLKRILDLTNMERGKVSLPPLTFNSKLAAAAQKHSQSMAMQDFFAHRQMVERVTAEGYQYSRVGENISAGNSTLDVRACNYKCPNLQSRHFQTRIICNYNFI